MVSASFHTMFSLSMISLGMETCPSSSNLPVYCSCMPYLLCYRKKLSFGSPTVRKESAMEQSLSRPACSWSRSMRDAGPGELRALDCPGEEKPWPSVPLFKPSRRKSVSKKEIPMLSCQCTHTSSKYILNLMCDGESFQKIVEP